MVAVRTGRRTASVQHRALLYRDPAEYTATVSAFLLEGLADGERAYALVPDDPRDRLRAALGRRDGEVEFADMTSLGGNPARIIPAIEAFLTGGSQPARVVTEPAWPGRTAAELTEVVKHEALVNLAFAGRAAQFMCPYDAARLPGPLLADARRTHPGVTAGAGGPISRSRAYRGPGRLPASCTAPLPPPPASADVLGFDADLRSVRGFIAARAEAAALPSARSAELVLAVSEVAANTLKHAGGSGSVLCWQAAGELICELRDRGQIGDPLAGRRLPGADQVGGHGLWLVHRCVDLAEVRSGRGGTATRLHMRLSRHPGPPAPAAARGRLVGSRVV
jgi:anti-sigma regulatory factor (Ser/Thr protein kinase)